MIIIYYKSKTTGAYTRVHENRPGCTMAQLEPLIENFNAESHKEICGAVEVADDSLEAFLFGTRNQRARIDREALQDAISSVEDALNNLRFLED